LKKYNRFEGDVLPNHKRDCIAFKTSGNWSDRECEEKHRFICENSVVKNITVSEEVIKNVTDKVLTEEEEVVKPTKIPEAHSLFYWTGSSWGWRIFSMEYSRGPGPLKKVAVDNQGRPWVVTASGEVWRWKKHATFQGELPLTLQKIEGTNSTIDIAIGPNGDVYILKNNS